MKPNLFATATAALLISALAGCGAAGTTPAAAKPSTSGSSARPAPVSAATRATPSPTAAAPAAPAMTAGQKNALGSAKDYLAISAFSRKGLIQQLSSSAGDGYSVADATYAADHVGADWKAEAVKAAKQYLSTMSFSRAGLIQQLSSSAGDGYTLAQATYGVTAAGL